MDKDYFYLTMFFIFIFVECVIIFSLMCTGAIYSGIKEGESVIFRENFLYGWIVFVLGILAFILAIKCWFIYKHKPKTPISPKRIASLIKTVSDKIKEL